MPPTCQEPTPSHRTDSHLGPTALLQVYLDIGIAPTALKPSGERTLGSKSVIPIEDAAPAGRIVLGEAQRGG